MKVELQYIFKLKTADGEDFTFKVIAPTQEEARIKVLAYLKELTAQLEKK